jgi:hypothetical protein
MALVAVVSLARADAPTDQYELFGSGDLTIHDVQTGLHWQRTPPTRDGGTATYTFEEAADYCQGLSLDNLSTWRVPSYKELLTLVDENPHYEYDSDALVPHAIDPNAFPATPVNTSYWTSSIYPEDPSQDSAYAVDFKTGLANWATRGTALYLRCVH